MYTYIYVTEIAKAVAAGKDPKDVIHSVNAKCVNGYNCPRGYYCVTLMQDEINQRFYDGGMTTEDDRGKLTGEVTWADLLGNKYTVNNENKSLYIYGLALHILTDTFSHSSFEPNSEAVGGWKRITHAGGADKIKYIPQRYSCATYISNLLIEHIIKKETGSVADFFNLITSPVFTGEFRLGNLSESIKAIDESYYNFYKVTIDKMSFWEAID